MMDIRGEATILRLMTEFMQKRNEEFRKARKLEEEAEKAKSVEKKTDVSC